MSSDVGDTRGDVRRLAREHGWNATSWQVLNPGFSYWVTPDRSAAVAYVSHHGVRVVAGVPLCDRLHMAQVVTAFERDAAAAGQGVAYFCVESRALPAVVAGRPDAAVFVIGAQPVWRPRVLSHTLNHHASLRAQLNRARNKGVAVRQLPSAGDADVRALHACLQQWLDRRGLPALHFLVEPDTLSGLEDRIVFVAEREGELVGFLVATPIPLRHGWLIEQLVRGHAAPNGTAEALLAGAAAWMTGHGAAMVTLGLSPLSRHAPVQDAAPPPAIRALFAWLRAHGRRFYNFEGLDAFKAKFQPESWEPVYAALPDRRQTMRSLIAVGAAFGGTSAGSFVLRIVRHALSRELHAGVSMVGMRKRRAT